MLGEKVWVLEDQIVVGSVRTERWLIEARKLPISPVFGWEPEWWRHRCWLCDGKLTIFLQDPNIEILLNLIRMEEEEDNTQSSFILTSDSRDSCCQFEYFYSMDSGNWHGNRKILKAVKSLSKLFEENFNWHFAYPQLSVGWILSSVHTVVAAQSSHWLIWSRDPGAEPIRAGDSGWSSCTCYILTQSSLECEGEHTFRSSKSKSHLFKEK